MATALLLAALAGCEPDNTVLIQQPTGFPIVLVPPDGADRIFGDDNSLHFQLGESDVMLSFATADAVPPLVARARAEGVTEIDGQSIEETKVVFGDVQGTRWRLTPLETTFYLLDAPGDFVAIRVRHSTDRALSRLEESLASLQVEHLP